MTHVFIVQGDEYNQTTILGVFDSLDKAKALADSINAQENP
jgi:hypothetical protein